MAKPTLTLWPYDKDFEWSGSSPRIRGGLAEREVSPAVRASPLGIIGSGRFPNEFLAELYMLNFSVRRNLKDRFYELKNICVSR